MRWVHLRPLYSYCDFGPVRQTRNLSVQTPTERDVLIEAGDTSWQKRGWILEQEEETTRRKNIMREM